MSEQIDAFATPAPHSGSATSKEAAEKVEPKASNLRARVLQFVLERAHAGATDEEMQNGLRMNPSTQRPRRRELVQRGKLVESGRTRRTASGRSAIVWIVPQ